MTTIKTRGTRVQSRAEAKAAALLNDLRKKRTMYLDDAAYAELKWDAFSRSDVSKALDLLAADDLISLVALGRCVVVTLTEKGKASDEP